MATSAARRSPARPPIHPIQAAAPPALASPQPAAATAPTAAERASPLAVLGAVLGCLAPVVLGLLFGSAYDALDRREPAEEEARSLHWAVVGVAAAAVTGGVFVALRTKPLLALGLVAFPLGFALVAIATTYSQTECVSGFWSSDCDTWGDQRGTLAAWAWIGLAAAAGGGALMLLAGRDWALGFPLAVGLGLAAAYLVASMTLLPRLSDEAIKAAESNEPIVHETPGLAAALLAVVLLATAFARLRHRPDD